MAVYQRKRVIYDPNNRSDFLAVVLKGISLAGIGICQQKFENMLLDLSIPSHVKGISVQEAREVIIGNSRRLSAALGKILVI